MQLIEEGRIELDEPVQTYLPGFTVSDPSAADRITVRQLVNQTTGLVDERNVGRYRELHSAQEGEAVV
jgi:CubicO group peptidase (beta-lactamase class C family)